MTVRSSFLAALLLGACAPQPVQLLGTVFADRGFDAAPLAGATVTAVQPPSASVLDETTTDANGIFVLDLPRATGVALEIRAEGYVPTVTHGNTPFAGQLPIEDGLLYPIRASEIESERALFAGCAGVDGPGAIVFGEVRVFGVVDEQTGENPLTTEGQVDVNAVDSQGETSETWEGCYLDEAGAAYDPTAEFTGQAGRFAVFGITPGLHELLARWQPIPGEFEETPYPAWVPPGEDVVALPQWPAFVEFP